MSKQSITGPSLAYEDPAFLGSEDGRPLRIVAEYLEPMHRFRQAKISDTIVFFGSARLTADGPMRRYYDDARELVGQMATMSSRLSRHRRSSESDVITRAP